MMMMVYMLTIIMLFLVHNWVSLLFLLEISTFMFCSMMLNNNINNSNLHMSLMKYYYYQSMFMLWLFFLLFVMFNSISYIFISIIFLKMGIPPFHSWFISVLQNSDLFYFWILNTFQKIPMMGILTIIMNLNNMFIMICMIITMSLTAINMSKKTSLYNFIIFSSMNHTAWMILSLYNNFNIFMMYMLIYYMSFTFFMIFMNYNKYMLPLNMLSIFMIIMMMGFPPSMLFF